MASSTAFSSELDHILDSAADAPHQALESARAALSSDPTIDIALAQMLERRIPVERALIILALIQDLGSCERVQMRLVPLLQHENYRVRSKAARVLANSSATVHWLKVLLESPDPRIRANTVEAVWRRNSPEHRDFLRTATRDPNNRVAANAWMGLLLLADAEAGGELIKMSRNSDPNQRSSAAWAMGHSREQQFLPRLTDMLREEHGRVRLSVLRAISAIRRAAMVNS